MTSCVRGFGLLASRSIAYLSLVAVSALPLTFAQTLHDLEFPIPDPNKDSLGKEWRIYDVGGARTAVSV